MGRNKVYNQGVLREFVNKLGLNVSEEGTPDADYVDKLVDQFQNGDKKAGEELIIQMAPYLIKYFKIVKLGIIDLSNKDSRKFISLFIDSADARTRLKKPFQSTEARNEAYQKVMMIQSVFNDVPAEDLVQELIIALLILAKRFSKYRRKVSFCGYLYNAYRFELSRRIKKIMEDPLTYRFSCNIPYDDYAPTDDEEEEENPSMYSNDPIMLLDDSLGNAWIRGITCGDMFSCLTQLQRLILKLYYNDGESDTSIARKLSMHRVTVRAERICAEKVLKEFIDAKKE